MEKMEQFQKSMESVNEQWKAGGMTRLLFCIIWKPLDWRTTTWPFCGPGKSPRFLSLNDEQRKRAAGVTVSVAGAVSALASLISKIMDRAKERREERKNKGKENEQQQNENSGGPSGN